MTEYLLLLLNTLLGLIWLLALPLLFHGIAFGYSRRFQHVLVSVLVANTILLTVMIGLGLAGWFYLWSVGGTALVLVAALACCRRFFLSPTFNGGPEINYHHILVLTLFLLFCLGALFIRHYPYHSDTWSKYLGAGAEVAYTGRIPTLDLTRLELGYSNAPLMMLYNAWEFSLWGRNDEFSRGIPVFFSTLTLLLLIGWGAEHTSAKAAPYLLAGVLIISQAFFRSFIGIIQEPPLLFSVTAMFYWLERYFNGKSLVSYAMLAMAAGLAVLSKFSAPIPVALVLVIALAVQPRRLPVKLLLGVIATLPALLWLGRNALVWGNPLYPFMVSLFPTHEPIRTLSLLGAAMTGDILQIAWVSPLAFIKDMALSFTLAPLAVVIMIRCRKQPLPWIVALAVLLTFLFLVVTGARWLERYFYPYVAVYALYGGLAVIAIVVWAQKRIARCLSWPWFALGLALLMAFELGVLYLKHPVPYYAEPHHLAVQEYFQTHAPEGNTVNVLVYHSFVHWYDQKRAYRLTRFWDPDFIFLTNREFDVSGDGEYLYQKLKQARVDYIYFAPVPNPYPQFWDTIARDDQHFELVLDKFGARIWKLK
ncbi:MAG: hypothetical protein JW953_12370 [Anaerolineae bacterium]|nr:hypothetical protein [Anaerolineae bacterium]